MLDGAVGVGDVSGGVEPVSVPLVSGPVAGGVSLLSVAGVEPVLSTVGVVLPGVPGEVEVEVPVEVLLTFSTSLAEDALEPLPPPPPPQAASDTIPRANTICFAIFMMIPDY